MRVKEKTIQLWNYTIDKIPLTDYTIGIASIEKMIANERAAVAIYKIKLGTPEDIAIVTAL
jgi:hypothetical protein